MWERLWDENKTRLAKTRKLKRFHALNGGQYLRRLSAGGGRLNCRLGERLSGADGALLR